MARAAARIRSAAASAVVAVTLAACGQGGGDVTGASGGGPTGPVPSVSPGTRGAPGTGEEPSPSSRPPITDELPVPNAGRPTTVTGVVAAGVEAGCLVLTSGGVTYELLGARNLLQPGSRVTVEGVVRDDLLTTCQQGRPLQVRTVRDG